MEEWVLTDGPGIEDGCLLRVRGLEIELGRVVLGRGAEAVGLRNIIVLARCELCSTRKKVYARQGRKI